MSEKWMRVVALFRDNVDFSIVVVVFLIVNLWAFTNLSMGAILLGLVVNIFTTCFLVDFLDKHLKR